MQRPSSRTGVFTFQGPQGGHGAGQEWERERAVGERSETWRGGGSLGLGSSL